MMSSLTTVRTLWLLIRMTSGNGSSGRSWPTTRITLLQRLADQRDEESWDSFAATYGPLVHRYCRRRGLQEADTLEVVQEVMLQVSKCIGEFHYDPELGRFRNWLGTVTHRAMLKHRAKSRRSESASKMGGGAALSAQASADAVDEVWVETFSAHVYREAIRRVRLEFNEETWLAFEATFVEERPPDEVAEQLQRTLGWVYQAKSQVVRRLREEIVNLAEDSILLNLD